LSLGQLSLPSRLGTLIVHWLVWLVVKVGCVRLCRVEGNTVWSHMASDAP